MRQSSTGLCRPRPAWKEKLQIRQTPVGKGVFARRQFRKGQIVGEILGKIVFSRKYQSRHCIELSDSQVLEPKAPFRYLNHSCEPNCELFSWEPDETGDESHRVYLQALRTIRVGEELTIDYAWEPEAAIPCQCQSEQCRGWIVAIEHAHQLKRSGQRKTKMHSPQLV